ncbi:MAG TPA: hypothetical protein VL689_06265 [Paraburkholderia sp.]|jgi:hypothetical protein|nr:hypothetical protein [Paraburkholderia sp.]
MRCCDESGNEATDGERGGCNDAAGSVTATADEPGTDASDCACWGGNDDAGSVTAAADEPGTDASDCACWGGNGEAGSVSAAADESGTDASDGERCGDGNGTAASAGAESRGDSGVLPAAGLSVPLGSSDEDDVSAATFADTCASGAGADPERERVAARSGIDDRLTDERGAAPSASEADARRPGLGDAFRLSKTPRPGGADGGVRGC